MDIAHMGNPADIEAIDVDRCTAYHEAATAFDNCMIDYCMGEDEAALLREIAEKMTAAAEVEAFRVGVHVGIRMMQHPQGIHHLTKPDIHRSNDPCTV